MKDFLKKIVLSIVSEGVVFDIKEENSDDLKIYTILAPNEEVGKLIGKSGKVINSIRTLCRLKALKTQERVLVKIGQES